MTWTNPYYRDFNYKGVSDHTPDFELFLKHSKGYEYWEKHVCLTKDCIEAEWSVTFEELEAVLK
jgi:sialic acid synthase SpsE